MAQLDVEQILIYASLALTAILLLKIYGAGLVSVYPAFAILMFSDLVFSLILAGIFQQFPNTFITSPWGQRFKLYPLAFVLVEIVKPVFYTFASVELFAVVLKPYRGIVRAGRVAIYTSLLAAALITIGISMLAPGSQQGAVLDELFKKFLLADRTVIFALALFLALMLIALLWFPVRMSRNARLHAVLYVTFFSGKALVFYAIVFVGRTAVRPFSKINLALYTACLIAWTLGLSREGENVQASFRGPWQAADPEELTRKLESINARLTKVSAKVGDQE